MKENAKIIWAFVWRVFVTGLYGTVTVTAMTDLIRIIRGENM